MQRLRVDDEVIVLAGKDKGKTGKIIDFRTKNKRKTVVVSKVNMVKKSLRQREDKEVRGFVDVERPIDISNVAIVSPKTGKATRVRIEQRDNKNVRIALACGTVLKNGSRKQNKK